MEHNRARTMRQPEQLPLFDAGETLVEVAVSSLTTEPELRDIGRSLVALTRYHASKVEAS